MTHQAATGSSQHKRGGSGLPSLLLLLLAPSFRRPKGHHCFPCHILPAHGLMRTLCMCVPPPLMPATPARAVICYDLLRAVPSSCQPWHTRDSSHCRTPLSDSSSSSVAAAIRPQHRTRTTLWALWPQLLHHHDPTLAASAAPPLPLPAAYHKDHFSPSYPSPPRQRRVRPMHADGRCSMQAWAGGGLRPAFHPAMVGIASWLCRLSVRRRAIHSPRPLPVPGRDDDVAASLVQRSMTPSSSCGRG